MKSFNLNSIRGFMLKNLINYFFKSLYILGFIITIVFLSLIIVGYSGIKDQSISINSEAFLDSMHYLWIGMIGTILMTIMAFVYMYINYNRPIKSISEKVKFMAKKDITSLSTALTEIAQGDLTASIKVNTEEVKIKNKGSVGEMVNALNSIIFSLQEASKEFNNATDTPCKRLFYVGADSYLEGKKCAEAAVKILNGKGSIIIAVRSFSNLSQELRKKGFQTYIKENCQFINIKDVYETSDDENTAYESTKLILKKNNNIDLLYVTHSGGATIAKAVSDSDKAGKVKIITHDLSSDTMNYVKDGLITATISQDGYGQGYDTIINIFNHLVAGWKPGSPRLLTNMEMVTKDNYQLYWQPGKGVIESEYVKIRRPKPVKESPRKINK